MDNATIAREISRQIGNRAFCMMGSTEKFIDGPGLIFNVRGSKTTTKIKVTLAASDTYTVTFYKIGRAPAYKIEPREFPGVYSDNLKNLIENETGSTSNCPADPSTPSES
jgi:hypothetical protein